jgi:hypothetical protein
MGMIASVAGHAATTMRIYMSAWGCWYVEAQLDGERTLSGSVEVKAADLTLQGTVLSGGAMKGRSSYRIVAGAGGWGRVLPMKSYATDAGVKVRTVIGDAAQAVGETVSLTTTDTTGPSFTRNEGRASLVLESIAPQAWYVGEDGVTRLGRRSATTLTAAVPRVSQVDLARGCVTLAPTSLAALVPGITVDGIEAVDVIHDITPEGVRTTIYGARGAGQSRRLDAWRKLFEQLDPDRDFRAVWEYRVVTQSGERLNLQAVRRSAGMPDLELVRVRPGLAGARSDVALASRVLVAFVNAERGRPEVIAFEDADGAGFTPLLTEIDASTFVKLADGARPVAATGDIAGGIWPIVGTTRVLG